LSTWRDTGVDVSLAVKTWPSRASRSSAAPGN